MKETEVLLEAERNKEAESPENCQSGVDNGSRKTICQIESPSEDVLLDEENPFDNVDE